MSDRIKMTLATVAIGGLALSGISPASAASVDTGAGDVAVLKGSLADVPVARASSFTEIGDLTLFAWPAEEVLAAASPGEAVKLTPIAETTVSSDGAFEFTVLEGTDFSRFSGGTDYVNVSMAGVAGGSEYWYSTSISADPASAAIESEAEPLIPTVSINSIGEDNSEASEVDTYTDKACYTSTTKTYASKAAIVGYTANSLSGGSAQLKHTSGANGKFGVGVSASGNYGSFSASGTTTVTSGTTITYAATKSGARTHRAYLVPKKYKIYCETNAGIPISTKYELRPASYTGGSATAGSSTFTTNAYCTPVGKNTTTSIDSSRSTTSTIGFKTNTVIGIDLSSQSGYNKQTQIVLKTTTKSGQICGEKGYPGGTPGRVKLK